MSKEGTCGICGSKLETCYHKTGQIIKFCPKIDCRNTQYKSIGNLPVIEFWCDQKVPVSQKCPKCGKPLKEVGQVRDCKIIGCEEHREFDQVVRTK